MAETQTGGYRVDVLLTDPEIVGGTSAVKNKLATIVSSASTKLSPANTHILFNWKTPMNELELFPIVTMRLGTAQFTDTIYGRVPKSGQHGKYIIYPFSLHIWAEKLNYELQEGNESEPATDLADLIINKLENFTGDRISGICYFYNITSRESEPERGPKNLCRVIVEGFMQVKRLL